MITDQKVYAYGLNKAGVKYVENRLKDLGLGWDVHATIMDIEETSGFMELQPGDAYTYEIANTKAKAAGVGPGGYGVFAYINIDTDSHVKFRDLEG